MALILQEQVSLPPKNTQNLSLKTLNVDILGYKKNERHFNCDFQVFAYIILVMYKMFVLFRKCLGTDTPRKNLFTTPEHPNLALRLLTGGTVGYR